MLTRYLNPKNDVAFKAIFGSESHKDVLIRFLNTILELKGSQEIQDVDFLNPFQAPRHEKAKQSIVDVLVKDKRDIRYIVEMQVSHTPDFAKRAQYYAAKTYVEQLKEGDHYPELNKVYFIAIADHILFPEKDDYKSSHLIRDHKTGENDLKDFRFTFVELPKFTKLEEEIDGIEEEWLFFLRHAEDLDHIPEKIKDAAVKKAFNILERFAWTGKELLEYEDASLAIGDEISARKYEREQGVKEGMEKGIEQVAINMLKESLPMGNISKLTGLSVDDINKIAEQV